MLARPCQPGIYAAPPRRSASLRISDCGLAIGDLPPSFRLPPPACSIADCGLRIRMPRHDQNAGRCERVKGGTCEPCECRGGPPCPPGPAKTPPSALRETKRSAVHFQFPPAASSLQPRPLRIGDFGLRIRMPSHGPKRGNVRRCETCERVNVGAGLCVRPNRRKHRPSALRIDCCPFTMGPTGKRNGVRYIFSFRLPPPA